jgi:hypothetical protein
MSAEPNHIDSLQNLEFVVARFYRADPELTDFAVQQAYDSLLDKYGAEQRGTQRRPRQLNEIQQALAADVEVICEMLLGLTQPDSEFPPQPEPIDLTVLIRCLRKLQNSLKKWTKNYGRRGYLDFISPHLPG